MGITRDVSRQLDAFSQVPGSVLVRDGICWKALTPAEPGQVLGLNDDNEPEWITNPGGIVQDTGWQSLTLINGWEHNDTRYPDLQYRQLASGAVYLKGKVEHTDPENNPVCAVIPSSIRPALRQRFPIRAGADFGQLEVRDNGDLHLDRNAASNWYVWASYIPDGV